MASIVATTAGRKSNSVIVFIAVCIVASSINVSFARLGRGR
jgi:hypothetical protein